MTNDHKTSKDHRNASPSDEVSIGIPRTILGTIIAVSKEKIVYGKKKIFFTIRRCYDESFDEDNKKI